MSENNSEPTPGEPGRPRQEWVPIFLEPAHFDPSKETKEEWATRMVEQLKSGLLATIRRQTTAELESLEDVQARIDRVAEDLRTGKRRYAFIESWKLATLLGLDFDDTSAWSRFSLAHRPELDEGSEHPFAENIHLLEDLVPPARYEELSAQAEIIEQTEVGPDLSLTPAEAEQLREAYSNDRTGESDLTLARTSLKSTAGDELDFEVCVGDGGEPFDACSPYDLQKGGGLDTDKYKVID